jgi:hypothetical protein
MALIGESISETPLAAAALVANLVALVLAVAELRQVQRHAAQAAAARTAAELLRTAARQVRSQMPIFLRTGAARAAGLASAAYPASHDFPVSPLHGQPQQAPQEPTRPSPLRRVQPPKCAGPAH